MWTDGVVLARDSDCKCCLIYSLCQSCQLRTGFDSNPEHSRGFRGWKEAVGAEIDFYGRSGDGIQSILDSTNRLFRFLPDKLQSHVQRLGTNPARVGRKSAYAFHEASDPLADGVVNIEADENSHNRRSSSVVRRGPGATSRRTEDQRPATESHQPPSHHVERLLTGEPADAFAIAGKSALHDFSSEITGQAMKHQPHGLFCGSALWAGDASDSDAESRATA